MGDVKRLRVVYRRVNVSLVGGEWHEGGGAADFRLAVAEGRLTDRRMVNADSQVHDRAIVTSRRSPGGERPVTTVR
jgi:hypothetical protein